MDYENDTSWVRGMLHPGENLLWTGRPGKGHLLRKEDIFLIPFSLIWCGFVVFWEYTALKSGAPVFFLLFGILFVLAGLFLTVGRFLLAAYRGRRTSYALTSERIIAQTGSTRKALNQPLLVEQIEDNDQKNAPEAVIGHEASGKCHSAQGNDQTEHSPETKLVHRPDGPKSDQERKIDILLKRIEPAGLKSQVKRNLGDQ